MLSKIKTYFNQDIGIDLGTKNTVIYVKKTGQTISEPSVVAVNSQNQSVIAIGNLAKDMVGRTPGNIIAMRPMKHGVIADFEVAKKMIEAFIYRTKEKSFFSKPRILIGIPWGITAVEKRAVTEAAYCAGASAVYLVDEPMAAALGVNLPIDIPGGHLLVDIGGGTTEVAVISLYGIVICKSIRTAGDAFDEAIIDHCKKNYNLFISESMAESIKFNIGTATSFESEKEMLVKGRNLLNGFPQSFTLSSFEIHDALHHYVNTIVMTIKSTLESTPPELSGDIINNGVILTGGGALLHGLGDYITKETGLSVKIANNPLPCVAEGTGKILNDYDLFSKISSSISK